MAPASPLSFVDTLLSGALRLAGRVLLLLLVAWLALLGLALGVVLLVGSLLRGRRPALRFRFGGPPMDWQRFRPGATRPAPASDRTGAEVIEGQAREVPPR